MTTAATTLPADTRLAFTFRECADVTPFSQQTIERAARKPFDDGVFPHPLKAHRDSKRRGIVLRPDLERWLEQLPDF